MPPRKSTVSAKRKAPAFKPPQPTTKAQPTTSTAPHRRKSAPARPPISFSSSEDEAVDEQPTSRTIQSTEPISLSQEPPPTIPPKLLTKLLHHHFDDEKTRIAKDANALVGKYMETFVREALARAAFERNEAGEGKSKGGDFLEVGYYAADDIDSWIGLTEAGGGSGEACAAIDSGLLGTKYWDEDTSHSRRYKLNLDPKMPEQEHRWMNMTRHNANSSEVTSRAVSYLTL